MWIVGNLAIAPAQAGTIHSVTEAPGQLVYQTRHTLKDQQGHLWQAIAFKRIVPDGSSTLDLRLVGFPGVVNLDHSRPLRLTNSLGKTVTAANTSQTIFTDQAHPEPNIGQYDLQSVIMQLEPNIPLGLALPTLDSSPIYLNVSPAIVETWRSLSNQRPLS